MQGAAVRNLWFDAVSKRTELMLSAHDASALVMPVALVSLLICCDGSGSGSPVLEYTSGVKAMFRVTNHS